MLLVGDLNIAAMLINCSLTYCWLGVQPTVCAQRPAMVSIEVVWTIAGLWYFFLVLFSFFLSLIFFPSSRMLSLLILYFNTKISATF